MIPRTIVLLALLAGPVLADDAADSKAAFLDVYKVLMHPRCLNCHPKGDRPLQGEDSHVHRQNVKRGPDGKGLFGQKCTSCHQPTNLAGENMPPGSKVWHLPSARMPLVFEGLSARQLAEQLKDPKRNGGKSLEQLVEHVTQDELVLWGWKPGDGRAVPPLSHEAFAQRFREWVDKGAAIPE